MLKQDGLKKDEFSGKYRRIYLVYLLWIFFPGCLFFSKAVYAQHPFYTTINDERGLPSNEVYQIVQDKQGYLWIGCDAGLYRYDGITFTGLNHPKQNSRSISNLKFDANGELWCSNFTGQIFRVSANELMLISDFKNEANKYAICFYDRPGFWKISRHSLSLYATDGSVVKRYSCSLKNEVNNNGTDMIYYNQSLWIELSNEGLYYMDSSLTEPQLLFPVSEGIHYQNQRLFVFKNKLYLLRSEVAPSVHNYIYEIDTRKKSYKQVYYFYNPLQIRNYYFYEDYAGKLWIGSSIGAICITDVAIFTLPEQICFWGNKISSVLHDQEGNYWFTDLQNGLYFIPEIRLKTYDEWNGKGVKPFITALQPIGDTLLAIGHYDGSVGLFDVRSKQVEYLPEYKDLKSITVKDMETDSNMLCISRGRMHYYDLHRKQLGIFENLSNSRDFFIYRDTCYSIHPEVAFRFPIPGIPRIKKSIPSFFIRWEVRKTYLKNNQVIFILPLTMVYSSTKTAAFNQ